MSGLPMGPDLLQSVRTLYLGKLFLLKCAEQSFIGFRDFFNHEPGSHEATDKRQSSDASDISCLQAGILPRDFRLNF